MNKTIAEILAPKPEARPRLYAYSIADQAHAGLLKVGQTTRVVKQRVKDALLSPSPPFRMEERAGERRRSGSWRGGRCSKDFPSPQPSPRSCLAGRGSRKKKDRANE